MAATVFNWLHQSGKLVTFGAFTAELELDIARTAVVKGELELDIARTAVFKHVRSAASHR